MQKCQKTGKKLFFIYLQSTFNRYILLRGNLNFIIFYFFHAYISLFAANMFLLCNTCHFITANTFGYKKSVRRIIAKDWTWRCYRGIILRIYMIFWIWFHKYSTLCYVVSMYTVSHKQKYWRSRKLYCVLKDDWVSCFY